MRRLICSWKARESPTRNYMYTNFTPLRDFESLVALRGQFDGGRSEIGSAVGFWLQGLIVNHTAQCQEWRTLQETGTVLDHDASAMETEFTAALQLFEAAQEATTKMIRR